MGWEFAGVLLAALVLTGLTSVWQMKRYTAEVNRLAREFRGPGRQLVTGRHKGRLAGAVVALVVDVETNAVLAGEAMTGSTFLARLKPDERLAGPLGTIAERVDGPVRTAVEDALGRVRRDLPGSADAAPASAGGTRKRVITRTSAQG